jgi:hypothetical protein
MLLHDLRKTISLKNSEIAGGLDHPSLISAPKTGLLN